MPKVPLNVRVDKALREQLKAQAEQENRTLSNLIDTVLRQYLKTGRLRRPRSTSPT